MSHSSYIEDLCFNQFKTSIEGIELPKQFTFPFYYQPHSIAIVAANELQQHLLNQKEWDHNFGLEQDREGLVIGKMFGVLVVQKMDGTLGYLSAFSGKLAGVNHHNGFVAPVFDILEENGFFRKGEMVINLINQEIEERDNDPLYKETTSRLTALQREAELEVSTLRETMRIAKSIRHAKKREGEKVLNENELHTLLEELKYESLKKQHELRLKLHEWDERIQSVQSDFNTLHNPIIALKEERKEKSSALQQKLFDEYYFLNKRGKKKSLGEIFEHASFVKPPAGAGECAAPKLLQHAFIHNYKPIALAEFWWGESPKSEIRKHQSYYPACRGKCEPILMHMLEGIELDKNPMLDNPAVGKELSTVYEDDELVVINKPAEFLSVPGKTIEDSVYFRMKQKYPTATGPLIVHRLDMSTSGLMIIAKTKEANKMLQSQFINRTIKKRYVALLEGVVQNQAGIVDLPIRVDLDDRPRQLVCYDYGKSARTKWEVISISENKTKVYFYPITGRTHQLRVHAAHQLGLNAPIVGDDLYGIKANRLHLHAESIEFFHPKTHELISLSVEPDF